MINKINNLLNSDISNYRISQETGIAESTLSDLTSGKSKVENIKLINALKLSKFYDKIKGEIDMKTWEYDNYTVEMVDHDYDLKAFEITQGDKVQTIYPETIEDMNQIIEDLDNGEDVEGWEDGLGNTIVID